MADDEAARGEELVKACQVLYRCGIVDLVGHLSTRLEGERILVKPRRVSWLDVTPGDLVTIDYGGQRVDAPTDVHLPLQEWPIHAAVYRARPDVGAVLHAHPADSTLLASLDVDMQPLTRELAQLADDTVVAFDPRDDNGLVDRYEEGAALASLLGPKTILLLKHHGCVVVGAGIGDVCVTAYRLERAAQAMLKAAATRTAPSEQVIGLMADRQRPASPPLASVGPPASEQENTRAAAQANNRRPEVERLLAAERWAMLQSYYLK